MSEQKVENISDDFIIDFVLTDPENKLEHKDVKRKVKSSAAANNRISILAQHELFTKILKGNAMSIELFAKCIKMANADPERKE